VLKLCEDLDYPLGRANALANIGVAHFHQGNLGEARRTHEAALELHPQIGALAGQAGSQANSGTVLFRQIRLEEALKPLQPLQEARALFVKAGVRGRKLEAVEQLISRLRRRLARKKSLQG